MEKRTAFSVKYMDAFCIGAPVCKGREQKASLWRSHLIIADERTDGADKETVDFFGFPLIFPVTAFDRNIIITVKDIDSIGITGLIVFSDVLIQVVEECIVFQFTLPECHKELPHAITDTRLWLDPEIFKLFVWFCKWNSFCYFYRFFLIGTGQFQKMRVKCAIDEAFLIHIGSGNPAEAVSCDRHAAGQL